MRYDYDPIYVPGKDMHAADTLSRAPLESTENAKDALETQVEAYVNCVVGNLPASDKRLQQIRDATAADPVSRTLAKHVLDGWPDHKADVPDAIKPFWSVRSDLSIAQGIIFKGDRLFIPSVLRPDIIEKIHEGHMGIVKCRERARSSVYWPGLSRQIEDIVNSCYMCAENKNVQREPLMQTPIPVRPWKIVATDLFHLKGNTYLLIVDYYSRFVEVKLLTTTTSDVIVEKMKATFARHGIPDTLISDNGPQYDSDAFKAFANDYAFEHRTSSPRYPQANGEAERA
ncbi:uncharacterized protein K02A2.6-like, partial [Anneissia japonica]|uniref:uncharacterized protein K02A2.6-like n=1 Tax=Anneissia japonica TaxID=1529436 RepID=UPI0014254CFA